MRGIFCGLEPSCEEDAQALVVEERLRACFPPDSKSESSVAICDKSEQEVDGGATVKAEMDESV